MAGSSHSTAVQLSPFIAISDGSAWYFAIEPELVHYCHIVHIVHPWCSHWMLLLRTCEMSPDLMYSIWQPNKISGLNLAWMCLDLSIWTRLFHVCHERDFKLLFNVAAGRWWLYSTFTMWSHFQQRRCGLLFFQPGSSGKRGMRLLDRLLESTWQLLCSFLADIPDGIARSNWISHSRCQPSGAPRIWDGLQNAFETTLTSSRSPVWTPLQYWCPPRSVKKHERMKYDETIRPWRKMSRINLASILSSGPHCRVLRTQPESHVKAGPKVEQPTFHRFGKNEKIMEDTFQFIFILR